MATAAKTSPTIRFGPFELDVRAGELRKHGIRLPVQGRPIQALAILVEQAGQLVTREELRRKLWPADTFVDFDHSLHNAIARLRDVMGDSAESPKFIETLPRRGYRYIGPSVTSAVNAVQAASPPKASAAVLNKKRPLIAVALVIIIAVGAIGAAAWWSFRLPAGTPAIRSLAVLPLENLSGDPSQEYFADGMTDDLITELAQIGSLRIISRTSVMHYKATKKTVPEIARELRVDALLEGSVARAGSRVRITAQLIDSEADKHLWAGSYEGEARDVLNLQDHVARDVVKHIRLRLSSEQQARLNRVRTVNPEAHEAYLKGLYNWNKRGRAGLEKAIEYFNRAIAIDPNYALPYAGLAQCYVPLSYFGYMPGTEAQTKVTAALQKAKELDDSLAEAHTASGSAKSYYEYDWEGAEEEFRRAIELSPNYATAHQWYAQMLGAEGRGDEALAEHMRAFQLDPLSLIIYAGTLHRLYMLRRYPEAATAFKQALEMDPEFPSTHWNYGLVLIQQRDFQGAIRELEKAESLLPGNALMLGGLGYAYGISGNQQQARRILRQLRNLSAKDYVDPYAFALVYIALNDKNSAFTWLEKAVADRDPWVTFINSEPMMDGLRSDPRFNHLLGQMKLAH